MRISEIKPGEVEFQGWIENLRDKKSMQFVVIRDLSGKIQITVVKDEHPEIAEIFSHATLESTVRVKGTAVKNDYVKLGGIEIIPNKVELTSHADALPIGSDSSIDQRLDYRWIDLREEKKALTFRVETTMERAMQEWFVNNNFIGIHTPHITPYITEGEGSEVFKLDYFGQKAYLTQSSQLFKQCAMASGFERTFEIGPCFRANKSFTSRHDTEFIQVDAEISFINSHNDVMDIEEAWVKYFCKAIEEKHHDEILEHYGIDFKAPDYKFPRIPLREAFKLIKEEKGYEVPVVGKEDLDPMGEQLISEIVKERYGSDFVFITDFPFKSRAFYSMKQQENPELSKTFDLLYKGLEVTSGAQREHRYDILKSQLAEKGINPENMDFYTRFFKYGCPPHGGFGFGPTRFLKTLFNTPSVKEVTFLFRGPNRLDP